MDGPSYTSLKVRKTTRRGVELCFQKLFFLTFWKTVPRFRVWSSSESDLSSES